MKNRVATSCGLLHSLQISNIPLQRNRASCFRSRVTMPAQDTDLPALPTEFLHQGKPNESTATSNEYFGIPHNILFVRRCKPVIPLAKKGMPRQPI
jgi:hypothetical protein